MCVCVCVCVCAACQLLVLSEVQLSLSEWTSPTVATTSVKF